MSEINKLKEEQLENVSGGSGATPDFAYVARQLVIEDGGKSKTIKKTVDGYTYVIETNFVEGMGPYTYKVYNSAGNVVSIGTEADFAI